MQQPRTILLLSTYPPQQCGIATYTKHLHQAMRKQSHQNFNSSVIAVNNNRTKYYDYPKEVLHQVVKGDEEDFFRMSQLINSMEDVALVHIEHEFGIFGGDCGSALLPFLKNINKPVIVTYHTVLPEPTGDYKKMTIEVSNLAAHIVVMNKTAADLLQSVYNVPAKKISVIPHGIPNIFPDSSEQKKKQIGLEGRFLLSSFGLMNPDKGFEYTIEALKDVVKKHPEVLYLIIGETHPNIVEKQGEVYRQRLLEIIKKNKLTEHVKFYNKYLDEKDVIKFLLATDIYLSSSQNPDQITSGTLSYAIGAGKATISTPFLHAKEFARDNLCLLAEFHDTDSFTKQINELIENPQMRADLDHRAYAESRHMTWENVAIANCRLYQKVLKIIEADDSLPALLRPRLDHILRLTDNFGIIQFAHRVTPDIESGYTIDDVSRALIALCEYWALYKKRTVFKVIDIYLNFIEFTQQDNGRFYNIVDKNRVLDDQNWSGDAHGRTMWALAYLLNVKGLPRPFKERARILFKKSLLALPDIKTLRSMSFATAGLYFYNKSENEPLMIELITKFADKLVKSFNANTHDDWQWFEDKMTYSNSKLPEALFYAYHTTKKIKYQEVGVAALDFLRKKTIYQGVFHPIGQNGWYKKDGRRTRYDQQPVDVASMTRTLMVAYLTTNNEVYRQEAMITYRWFLGKNALNQMMYDSASGGCYDGLQKDRVNLNQGAESTVTCFLARLTIEDQSNLL